MTKCVACGHANNRALTCKKCNNDRGSDMPELTQETNHEPE